MTRELRTFLYMLGLVLAGGVVGGAVAVGITRFMPADTDTTLLAMVGGAGALWGCVAGLLTWVILADRRGW